MKTTRELKASNNPTGGDPIVESIFKQVDEAAAKARRVATKGTPMSPTSAPPAPANVVPARKGSAR